MRDDLMAGVRFFGDLRRHVRRPLDLERAKEQMRAHLQRREESFLEVLRVAVYGHGPSPYRKLLAYHSIGHEDVVDMVRAHGLEGTLERLHDAGVYLTLDQFKGRQPIERPGLSFMVHSHDLDSPLLGGTLATRTGGSRGTPRRIRVDPASLAYEAAYNLVGFRAMLVDDRPYAMWRPVPPASAGIKDVLREAMAGRALSAWFSQTDPSLRTGRHAAQTRLVLHALRLWGADVPMPVHAPLEDPTVVVDWLAANCAAGHPALISLPGSSAVRICASALDRGVSIAGTVYRVGGEPFTPARAAVLAAAGARGFSNYAMSEVGRVGLGCGNAGAVDDVHLMADKLALIGRPPQVPGAAGGINAWFLTTLLAALPKIMLNVETGDYGVVEQRQCGCLLGELGLTTHLHTIRSYEKLTTEGMHFTGTLLLRLIEEVLPAQVGGDATCYQLVERQEGGLTRVDLVVSPRVGSIDDNTVISLVLRTLGGDQAATKMMANIWEQASTLCVVRREPHSTTAGKIQPLHVQGGPL